jgi:hypothetical protein
MTCRLPRVWRGTFILNVLPYVGSAIYFLFGEIDLGNHANQRNNGLAA